MNITAGMDRLNQTASTGTRPAALHENGFTSADDNLEKIDWKSSQKDKDTFVKDIDKWMTCHASIKGFAECPPKAYHTDGYSDLPKSMVRDVPRLVAEDIKESSHWLAGNVSVAGMFVSAGVIFCGLVMNPALALAGLFLGVPASMGLGSIAANLYVAAKTNLCTHNMEQEMAKEIVKNCNNIL